MNAQEGGMEAFLPDQPKIFHTITWRIKISNVSTEGQSRFLNCSPKKGQELGYSLERSLVCLFLCWTAIIGTLDLGQLDREVLQGNVSPPLPLLLHPSPHGRASLLRDDYNLVVHDHPRLNARRENAPSYTGFL